MIKRVFFFVVILALALSACQGASPGANSNAYDGNPTASATVPSSAPATTMPPPAQPSVAPAAAVPPGCTVVSAQPTPGPTQESLFPSVSASDWVRGPADASITIIEYADFQCPACSQLEQVLEKLEQA